MKDTTSPASQKLHETTVREALEAYYAKNPGLTRFQPGEPGAELFMPHDICHVVFGLGTSLVEETLVDVWTMAGSDVRLRTYIGYTKYIGTIEPAQIIKEFGWIGVIRETLSSAPYAWRAFRAARRMKKPWPFKDYETYLDKSLNAVRREFGIEVVKVEAKHQSYSTVSASATQTHSGARS